MKDIIMYVWQLPQNLLGLLLRAFYKGMDLEDDIVIRRSPKMRGGISLGKYIIVSVWTREMTVRHEIGHCKQPRKLGWLYLPVIGLPSIVWAGLYGWIIKETPSGYYKFFTEKWADKLGGITR